MVEVRLYLGLESANEQRDGNGVTAATGKGQANQDDAVYPVPRLVVPDDAKPEEQRQGERDCAQTEHFEPLIGGEVEPGLIKKNKRKGHEEQMEQPHEPAEDLEPAQDLRFFRHVQGTVNGSKGIC